VRIISGTLFEIFEFKIASLGETGTGFFHLDPASQPRTEPAVRGTAEFLLKKCTTSEIASDDGLVYSLIHGNTYGESGTYLMITIKKFKALLVSAVPSPRKGVKESLTLIEKEGVPLSWGRYWAISQFKRK